METVRIQKLMIEAAGKLPEYQLESGRKLRPRFEFGVETELIRVIKEYGPDGHFPLIWLTPTTNQNNDFFPWLTGDVTLNICTLEPNTGLMNVARIPKSYEGLLVKVWEDLAKAMRRTRRIQIDETSVEFNLIPNYPEGAEAKTGGVIWDVLQVNFTALFAPMNECLIN